MVAKPRIQDFDERKLGNPTKITDVVDIPSTPCSLQMKVFQDVPRFFPHLFPDILDSRLHPHIIFLILRPLFGKTKTKKDEAHISTFSAEAEKQARFSCPHGDQKRPARNERTPSQRTSQVDCQRRTPPQVLSLHRPITSILRERKLAEYILQE